MFSKEIRLIYIWPNEESEVSIHYISFILIELTELNCNSNISSRSFRARGGEEALIYMIRMDIKLSVYSGVGKGGAGAMTGPAMKKLGGGGGECASPVLRLWDNYYQVDISAGSRKSVFQTISAVPMK